MERSGFLWIPLAVDHLAGQLLGRVWIWSGGNTGTLCNQMSATYWLPSRRKVYLEWV